MSAFDFDGAIMRAGARGSACDVSRVLWPIPRHAFTQRPRDAVSRLTWADLAKHACIEHLVLGMQPSTRVVVDVVVGVTSDPTVAGADPAAQERIAELADGLERLTHVFNRARARLLDKPRAELEWSALLLAKVLVIQGPLRAGMLAELVQSDPSTVSRQVAQLVADGFVHRETDPVDGRACMLAATAKAHRVVDEHRKIRDAHYCGMLEHWSEQDRDQFAALLARFVADFEAYAGRPVPTSRAVTSSSEWLATAGQGRNG